MKWQVPLSDIDFDFDEVAAVNEVLKHRWLSLGPTTERFERALEDYLGVKHVIAVANGTAALHIANKVLGIKKGDEVIVPSLTFVATANAVVYCGAKPVFADVTSLDDFNISPESILEKITPRTRAITVVHYGGYPCEMASIMEIARDHGLSVIEDAAHAIGAQYNGLKCGAIGDIGCFSFFANKNLVTGEGGAIVTNNSELAKKALSLRSHGMSSFTWDRYKGLARSYDVDQLGFNYRINEIASALGRAQLKKVDKNNERRARIVKEYQEQLKIEKDVSIPFPHSNGEPAYHIFPILLDNQVSRGDFVDCLRDQAIQTSIHYPPVHMLSLYRNMLGKDEAYLPMTERIGEREVTLPLYPTMDDAAVTYVVQNVKEALISGA